MLGTLVLSGLALAGLYFSYKQGKATVSKEVAILIQDADTSASKAVATIGTLKVRFESKVNSLLAKV